MKTPDGHWLSGIEKTIQTWQLHGDSKHCQIILPAHAQLSHI